MAQSDNKNSPRPSHECIKSSVLGPRDYDVPAKQLGNEQPILVTQCEAYASPSFATENEDDIYESIPS